MPKLKSKSDTVGSPRQILALMPKNIMLNERSEEMYDIAYGLEDILTRYGLKDAARNKLELKKSRRLENELLIALELVQYVRSGMKNCRMTLDLARKEERFYQKSKANA
jgi:hypothetical protein